MNLHQIRICLLIATIHLFTCFSAGYAQNFRCLTCQDPNCHNDPRLKRYLDGLRKRSLAEAPSAEAPRAKSFQRASSAQIVFLNFDGEAGLFNYTPPQRVQVQSKMEAVYARFEVSFTQTEPTTGSFAEIIFNAGARPFTGGSPATGEASEADFRNVNQAGMAVVNIDPTSFSESEILTLTANVGAHELGHLLGIAHRDSFGPIGSGVIPSVVANYNPEYPGPLNGFEFDDHIMARPLLVPGIVLSDGFLTPNWLSERSATKIEFGQSGIPVLEFEDNDSLPTAQRLDFQSLAVPNTIIEGQNSGDNDFSVSAVVVIGALDGVADGQDNYRIEGKASDLLTIEVLSREVSRFSDRILASVSVLNADEQLVDYYGVDALNVSGLDSSDSTLIDLILPADGDYFIRVDSPYFSQSGNYELYIQRFNGVVGDLNEDGAANFLDISPFIRAVSTGEFVPNADLNLDGALNFSDISPFIALISGS